MSRRSWDIDYGPLRGFYRDRENAWVFGVCAGLADRFNFQVGAVRLISVICLFLFSWLTFAIYVGIALLVKGKPLIYSGRRTEYDFWKRQCADDWSHS